MQLRKIKNQNKIIFLTTNNSTPIKVKRSSFSNSLNSNQNKSICRNRNIIKDRIINKNLSNNSLNNTQKYIFNCYKISPIIALSIYDKAINKILEYIKKKLPKNNFLEIKRKYISFVIEELHIKSKNILMNISDQDLSKVNVKLFTSNSNNSISISHNSNTSFAHYNKLNTNPNSFYKTNCNSNSLFQLNKNKLKRAKLLSFNSFNNTEFKKHNKSLLNSLNILQKKKSKNISHTEYNQKNNNQNNNNLSNTKIKKNISNINDSSPYSIPMKNIFYENKKKSSLKIINKNKIILNKNKIINNCYPKNIEENKQIQNDLKIINNNKNSNKNLIDIKDNEKTCVNQLNIIKENLEDNLKNMFNFSYGYFLNNERESDSSKSLHDLYKFNNNYYTNTK